MIGTSISDSILSNLNFQLKLLSEKIYFGKGKNTEDFIFSQEAGRIYEIVFNKSERLQIFDTLIPMCIYMRFSMKNFVHIIFTAKSQSCI